MKISDRTTRFNQLLESASQPAYDDFKTSLNGIPLYKAVFELFRINRKAHEKQLIKIIKDYLCSDSDMPRDRLFIEASKLHGALIFPETFTGDTVFSDYLSTAAATDEPVLLLGETGTGKEHIAEAIHDISERRNQPFKAVNCAAFTETLLESELFGYEKGSFTGGDPNGREGLFEETGEGTLFLDEIGDMTLPMQAKLLRVLNDKQYYKLGNYKKPKTFRGRIICATNKEIPSDHFRDDLYYRINVFRKRLKTFRAYSFDERRKIIKHILKEIDSDKKITSDALTALLGCEFKGNFRELRNTLFEADKLSEGRPIEIKDLSLEFLQSHIKTADYRSDLLSMDYLKMKKTFEDIEKEKIEKDLKVHRNVKRLASHYGIEKYQPFLRRIKSMGIGPKM